MDREGALKLLRGGEEGIIEWNQLDSEVRKNVDLTHAKLNVLPLYEADFSKANLSFAEFSNAGLSNADFSGADLSHAAFNNADVSEASFSGANLYFADFSFAHGLNTDLSHSILTNSRLSHTNFRNADLNGANLTFAGCFYTNFSHAILTNSNFNCADLSHSNLHCANVRSANFAEAIFNQTILSFVNLAEVKGLDTIKHLGPSEIGLSTIQWSGRIPDFFLRSCGVREEWITYIPSLIGSLGPIDFYSCFISYSHANKRFARRLHNDLQAKGIRCWLDEKEILPGEDIYKEVDHGVKVYDKILLCASKESLDSWWVEREIDRAFDRERELKKERGESVLSIIPLNLDGSLFEWDHPHAPALRRRLASNFTNWETDNARYEEQFELLVKALRADDGERNRPPVSKL